jgi:hypothetical protein
LAAASDGVSGMNVAAASNGVISWMGISAWNDGGGGGGGGMGVVVAGSRQSKYWNSIEL